MILNAILEKLYLDKRTQYNISMIQHCKNFDSFANDPKSEVLEVYPNIIGDDRGSFAEILKENVSDHSSWLSDLSWIKQVNRSKSKSGVIRGCHA